MKFRTEIPVFRKNDISHRQNLMLLGSCFSQHFGELFDYCKFRADVNPFGILYNPASIVQAVRRLLRPIPYTEKDIFHSDGLWHSFDHHGCFSDTNQNACLEKINERLAHSAQFLQTTDVLFITFGSAWIYREKSTDKIVSNCHKLPEKTFVRERLTIDKIVENFSDLIEKLRQKNDNIRIIFTVSPIRHKKDGLHENQLSKSILLLAVERLQRNFPDVIEYFPSYEIMLDDLRDYRFYNEDMIHPNEVAVRYIWEKFGECYFSDETKKIIAEAAKISEAEKHRPLNPDSGAFRAFCTKLAEQKELFHQKYPYLRGN